MRTFAIASLALALLACGGGAPARTAAEQSQIDARAIQTRINGAWKLVDYRPEVPLDAMTQALLTSQIQTMTVRFDSGRLMADSPTFHFVRTIQIDGAGGNLFKLIATDENGVSLTSSCELSDDGTKLYFHGETEPWRGMGTLSR
jgi:hypothetical protein